MSNKQQLAVPYPIFFVATILVFIYAIYLIYPYSGNFQAEVDLHQDNNWWKWHASSAFIFVSAAVSMMFLYKPRPHPLTRNRGLSALL